MTSAPVIGYDYARPSGLVDGALELSTSGGSTPDGDAAHPHFFSGFAEHPTVLAQGLLMLARVARTRYYVPPNTVAAILRAADPVVTATPDGLRFESFSACCGVYARLDLPATALDTSHLTSGVTNVDVNPPLRQALAALRPAEPLRLDVGSAGLAVTTLDGTVREEPVPLPRRWLQGFAETQVVGAQAAPQFEITGAHLRRFVQGLPRSSTSRTVMWATPLARAVRLASRPSVGAVCVAGPERLRALEPLLRFATALHAYGPDADADSPPMPSVWVLHLPGARLTLALSPHKARGFSGEGSVLTSLVGSHAAADADLIEALLSYEPRIDPASLAADAGLGTERVTDALNLLASWGQVGYDLAAGAYFHRPLPVGREALTDLHPRLAGATLLADGGAAMRRPDGSFAVTSADTTYDVRLAEHASHDRCTCPWYAKHRGERGPCKHVLAARIVTERTTA